jgi:hypothetical protein
MSHDHQRAIDIEQRHVGGGIVPGGNGIDADVIPKPIRADDPGVSQQTVLQAARSWHGLCVPLRKGDFMELVEVYHEAMAKRIIARACDRRVETIDASSNAAKNIQMEFDSIKSRQKSCVMHRFCYLLFAMRFASPAPYAALRVSPFTAYYPGSQPVDRSA